MKLLIVEDEIKIAEFMARGFRDEEFQVEVAGSAEEALPLLRKDAFSAYIIDVMLPGQNGIDLCMQLRESGVGDPILMLTAKNELNDKVTGLNAGADDYLTKPFEFAELLARMRALLRKTNGYQRSVIEVADLFIDPNSKAVRRGDETIELSKKEYQLLEYLARNRNRLVTRAMISQMVWDTDTSTYTNIIDVFITHLRKKIDGDRPVRLIHTVRGKGFILSPQSPDRPE